LKEMPVVKGNGIMGMAVGSIFPWGCNECT
jgi:hypothetical protein